MSVTLYLGPMFAGKTASLIRHWTAGGGTVAIKHSVDVRYGRGRIRSHDGLEIPAIEVNHLSDTKIGGQVDTVLIDEGHFFPDLRSFVVKYSLTKHIKIAALNGTFDQQPFESVSEVLPLCDSVEFLTGHCYVCGRPSIFSKRTIESKEKILIGGADIYQPCCRSCLNLE